VVNLSAEERERLEILLDLGKSAAQSLTRARILLKRTCQRPAKVGATTRPESEKIQASLRECEVSPTIYFASINPTRSPKTATPQRSAASNFSSQ
jgi:hypothetical protein